MGENVEENRITTATEAGRLMFTDGETLGEVKSQKIKDIINK